jgi:hypothetical protein
MSRFYEVGPIGEIAVNLFNGYGYNFYRAENQLRADDQRIRQLASSLLGRARSALGAAEASYRRERIPPPTRANPFPAPDIVAGAQRLERLGQAVGGVEGQVRNQPVPANDRMTQRYREETATLGALAEVDTRLVGQAGLLCSLVEAVGYDAVLAQAGEIETGIAAIIATLRERQMLLL